MELGLALRAVGPSVLEATLDRQKRRFFLQLGGTLRRLRWQQVDCRRLAGEARREQDDLLAREASARLEEIAST